jgi:hypothetical protein
MAYMGSLHPLDGLHQSGSDTAGLPDADIALLEPAMTARGIVYSLLLAVPLWGIIGMMVVSVTKILT